MDPVFITTIKQHDSFFKLPSSWTAVLNLLILGVTPRPKNSNWRTFLLIIVTLCQKLWLMLNDLQFCVLYLMNCLMSTRFSGWESLISYIFLCQLLFHLAQKSRIGERRSCRIASRYVVVQLNSVGHSMNEGNKVIISELINDNLDVLLFTSTECVGDLDKL